MSVTFDHIPFGFGRPAAQTAREIEDVIFEDITDNQEPRNADDSGAAKARRKQVAAAAMDFANRETAGKTYDPAFILIASINFVAGADWCDENVPSSADAGEFRRKESEASKKHGENLTKEGDCDFLFAALCSMLFSAGARWAYEHPAQKK